MMETGIENTATANEVTTEAETVTNTTTATNATDTVETGTTDPTENSTTTIANTNRLARVSTDNFCKFPFQLRNEVHWDCIPDDNGRGKVCNVEQEGNETPIFNDTSTFQLCGECSEPCGSKSFYSYPGFPVNNQAGSNRYATVSSWEECQLLCQQVEGCKFFNYHTIQQECELVSGVGGKKDASLEEVFFGPKFCPGEQLICVSDLYSSIRS